MIVKCRLVLLVLSFVLMTQPAFALSPYLIEAVSRNDSNAFGNDSSYFPSVSANGRFVTFQSNANNLVPGDSNNKTDIFVRDRTNNLTTRVSVSSSGTEANGDSQNPAISGDGRFIVFQSNANNLVNNDTNGFFDIFVHNLETGETRLVSVSSTGIQANNPCYAPTIDGDGSFVAFHSAATNLVSNDTNGDSDVFVRELANSNITRVSINNSGTQGDGMSNYAAISANGLFVAFESAAINLAAGANTGIVHVYVFNRQTMQVTLASQSTGGAIGNFPSSSVSISDDGLLVAFQSSATNLITGDTNGDSDIFVRDMTLAETTRVSVSSAGTQTTNPSSLPSISGNGRYVSFESTAIELQPGNNGTRTDIYVHDREVAETVRVNVSNAGVIANFNSGETAISSDGNIVVFESTANNLVPGDTLGRSDIFAAWNVLAPPPDPANAAPARNLFTALPFYVTWTPITGATEYEVQIDTSSTFSLPLDFTTIIVGNNQLWAKIETLPNEVYYWRVRALRGSSPPSAWSTAEVFRVAVP